MNYQDARDIIREVAQNLGCLDPHYNHPLLPSYLDPKISAISQYDTLLFDLIPKIKPIGNIGDIE